MGQYYDGSQMRFGPRMTPAVKKLIIANVVVFIFQTVVLMTFRQDYLTMFLGLSSYGVLHGMIWQPVTYMFLHYGLLHILANMFMLWMFGSSVESVWGEREFFKFYFFTGIAAGLLIFVTSLGSNAVTIGASGAIFGIMVAFGMIFPDAIILVFFLFPMRAKNAVLIFIGIELWITLTAGPYGGGVARFAHLGGALFGYLYLKYGDRVHYSLPRFPRLRINLGSRKEKKDENPDTWNSFMENEIDPILDKISREGFGSLTRRERKILKKGRGGGR